MRYLAKPFGALALAVWCILAAYLTINTEGYPRGSVDLDTPAVGR